jgi:ribosomal protein S18 acetylase RimI-like enzyme
MPADILHITVADIADARLLTELSITTFTETFAVDNAKENMDKYIAEELNEAKIQEEINDKNNLFFLAWYNGRLSGFAKLRSGKVPVGLEQNKPLEIERIYVLKEYHSKKIGAALMNMCLTYATTHGHDVIWLGVWGENHKAIRFYENYGFELFGSHTFTLGYDVQTDVLMKKMLVRL